MACISPDGNLTTSGKAVLTAAKEGATPEDIAKSSNLPLFRIRSSLRELVSAGLIQEIQGKYKTTAEGLKKLGKE